jgi:hypothetical protein
MRSKAIFYYASSIVVYISLLVMSFQYPYTILLLSNLEDNIILKDIGRDDKPVNIQSIAIMVLLLSKESRQYYFLLGLDSIKKRNNELLGDSLNINIDKIRNKWKNKKQYGGFFPLLVSSGTINLFTIKRRLLTMSL